MGNPKLWWTHGMPKLKGRRSLIAFGDCMDSVGWWEDGEGNFWFASAPNGTVTARIEAKTLRVVVKVGNNSTWLELEGRTERR